MKKKIATHLVGKTHAAHVIEETLTDGSQVYNFEICDVEYYVEIACADQGVAMNLFDLFRTSRIVEITAHSV